MPRPDALVRAIDDLLSFVDRNWEARASLDRPGMRRLEALDAEVFALAEMCGMRIPPFTQRVDKNSYEFGTTRLLALPTLSHGTVFQPTSNWRQAMLALQTMAKIGRPAKQKRKRTAKAANLTTIQTETVEVVGNCQGNIAKAARILGKDRKTVKQANDTAMKKLGKDPIVYGKGTKKRVFYRDARGADDLSEIDDQQRDSEPESKRKYRHRQ